MTPFEMIHVPTPGDHYSAATGSAIMTIVYEVSRVHARHGGETKIIVSRGTRHDYPVGESVEVRATAAPAKWQKAADVAMGRMGLPRYFAPAVYRPACDAIADDFAGPIFVHNNPVAVGLFHRRHPRAQICLWVNNELFRTYTAREIRGVASAARRLICASDYLAADLRAALHGWPELVDKVRVALSGVDVERFTPGPPIPEQQTPIVLFVGRVLPEKGPDLLLKAARIMAADGHRFRIRIVGSANFSASDPQTQYERELRALAEPLGDRVEFQPFVDREAVLGEYQRASVFCAPCNWNEPFGLTIAEAMACGLPVVTACRGGIPEVGGDAVRYVDVNSAAELAGAIGGLLSRPEERRSLGQAARHRVVSKLRWDDTYTALLKGISDSEPFRRVP